MATQFLLFEFVGRSYAVSSSTEREQKPRKNKVDSLPLPLSWIRLLHFLAVCFYSSGTEPRTAHRMAGHSITVLECQPHTIPEAKLQAHICSPGNHHMFSRKCYSCLSYAEWFPQRHPVLSRLTSKRQTPRECL